MWIAHYASGLIAKPFAPRVPLVVLAFAGIASDALFFVLQMLGIESFNLDTAIVRSGGCFPYTNDYPLSHSLVGMVAAGVLVAAVYKMVARVPAPPKDLAVIVAAAASHFLLEWPSHRHDTKITPGGDALFGAGLFDYPIAVFIAENLLFFAGLWVYQTFAPPASKAGMQQHPNLLLIVALVMVAQQANFCFMAAPTTETRWVHGPLFLFMILGSCHLIGMLDGQASSLGFGAKVPEALKKSG
ncbi:hypothetical protein PsYK624_023210 [Phanerochaete sordida]|uniref:Uncharacterized protein n=1 Tax=Phanerochaete sordida TaxID=48140 RepID=A0A9P3G101_9APHY|nr:hypothetical protein PsYK624_023210 [Phanerochaete sordida]